MVITQLTGGGNDIIAEGSGSDSIEGGVSNDVFLGAAGDDTLSGDEGDDILNAGEGADILRSGVDRGIDRVDSRATISDEDGRGAVYINNKLLTGGLCKERDSENTCDTGGNTYVLNGATFAINGGMTINDYSTENSDLKNVLKDEEEKEKETSDTGSSGKRTSAIVIDLDGDGIETLKVGTSYFDLDGDGLSEMTGWVSPDDGLLVHDRNGDSRIRNGTELFGNHSILSNGQMAENGFQALAEYDNNGDGVVDAQDVSYSELQVWRDLNGNGKSDVGELRSVADAGVLSISTGNADSAHTDAHGHQHRQIGTVLLADGTASTVADVWFKVDSARRVNSGDIELTPDIYFLANAKGFGKVHDLHQAMSLDPELKALLAQYVSATDATRRDALLDDLIYRWAGADEVDPYSRDPKKVYGHVMDARQLVTLEHLVGRPYMGVWCWGEHDPNPHGQAAPLLVAEYLKFKRFTAAQILAQTEYAGELSIIKSAFGSDAHGIEVKWGLLEGKLDALFADGRNDRIRGIITVLTDLGTYSPNYRAKRDSAFQAIFLSNSDLAPFFDFTLRTGTANSDTLNGVHAGTIFYGLAGDDRLYGQAGSDSYYFSRGDGNDVIIDQGGLDQVVFGEGIGQGDLAFSRNATTVWIHVQNADGGESGSLRIDNFFDFDGSVDVGAIEVIRFADGSGLSRQQILVLLATSSITEGNDLVFGTTAGDTIDAQAGNDSIHGLAGDDQLSGGAGDDVLMGDDGNDTLIGGIRNDSLIGGRGNDTYLFEVGHGNDVIDNAAQAAGTKLDRVVFGQGIDPATVSVERSGSHLVIHTSASDSIRLTNYFSGETANGTAVDEIVFHDGTVWSITDIKDMVLQASEGNDVLQGYASDDLLSGLEGNDQLYGKAGNDTLLGGEGQDTLDGGTGNDVLFGDTGNDVLRGGDGDDYLDGGEGNDNLAGGSGDDTLIGGAGNDYLSGGAGRDTLQGGDGDDMLFGGAGDDFLAGGKGNDYLNGATGANSYLFARGDGQDVIVDVYKGVVTIYLADLPLDNVVFHRIGSSLEATFTDSPDDRLSLFAFFRDEIPRSGIRLCFGEGLETVIEPAQLSQLTLEGTEVADLIQAYSSDDLIGALGGDSMAHPGAGNNNIFGGDGNDRLYAGSGTDLIDGGTGDDWVDAGEGDDVLHGGSGNDSLFGGAGNDVLAGGAGDDWLEGGTGDDLYRFAVGWGNDFIIDVNGSDSVQFTGVAPTDLLLRRDGADLVVLNQAIGDQLRIQGQFSSMAGVAGATAIEQFMFAGGTTWDYEAIKLKALEGTAQHDTIYGHSEGDVINAGAGNDLVYGLDGNDEIHGGEGADALYGGDGDDLLAGDTGDDQLDGGRGNDTLQGAEGRDLLIGGAGSDTYVFATGDGQDIINNLSNTPDADTDALRIEGTVRENLWLSRNGDNLVIDVMGSEDRITIQGWYTNSAQQLDVIQAGDSSLYANQVDTLVNAMAAFGAPAGGLVDFAPLQREYLNAVIAANWQ